MDAITAIPNAPTPIKIVITPEMAAAMLERVSPRQRGVSQTHVDQLAAEMTGGTFKANAGMVMIDWDGLLIDGQHRLHACVKANVPLHTFIATGVDPLIFDVIDIGKKRSANDVLRGDGRDSPKELASLAGAVLAVLNSKGRARNTVVECARKHAEDLARLVPLYREFAVMQRHHGWRSSPRAICGGLFCLTLHGAKSLDDVLEFGARLLAEDTPPRDPCRTLREWLIAGYRGNTHDQARATFAVMASAWNAYRANAERAQLKVTTGTQRSPICPKYVAE